MALELPALLRAESARFLALLRDADPAAAVPSCPGWSAADLLWHLAEVQHFWGTIVRDRLTDPPRHVEPARPADHPGLLEAFVRYSALLRDALDAADDDECVWTWFAPDQSVGFIRRRQVHEALIHRLDAEQVAGVAGDVDPALAADGVDEVLRQMYAVPAWASLADGTVGLVSADDTGREWLVRVGTWSGTSPGSGKTYAGKAGLAVLDDGEPQFRVSGTARDLDAWLWNRPGSIVFDGDAAAFTALIRTGVQ